MDLTLPDLGEGITQGEVARWLVKAGDQVEEDQVVLEVLTDKATVEIPTRFSGTVTEVVAKEGDLIDVGAVVLRLSDGTSAKHAPPAAPVKQATAPNAKSTNGSTGKAPTPMPIVISANVQAAPAVRKLARERGVDLTRISGTGPNGRILLSDVDGKQTSAYAGASAAGRATYVVETKSTPRAYTPPTTSTEREVHIPLRGLRKKIVEKMALSKRTAAHFTCVEECDVTELVEFRNSIKEKAKARGVHMTFMPFIAKACIFGLKKYPQLNSSLVEDGHGGGEIIQKNYYNLGVAVDTEDGLTVPVVHDVDRKSLMEIAQEVNDVSARARDRKLTQHDFAEGTFTISNAGKVGGLFATPIINYPEVAILGVHEIRKRPMVVNNEIKIRDIMYLSISLDHRVVDGATGILFLNEIISYLSNPKAFLLEMV